MKDAVAISQIDISGRNVVPQQEEFGSAVPIRAPGCLNGRRRSTYPHIGLDADFLQQQVRREARSAAKIDSSCWADSKLAKAPGEPQYASSCEVVPGTASAGERPVDSLVVM